MVIQLMRYGADPSIADGEGYRALHLAILFQHMAIAAYLMAKGQVSFPRQSFVFIFSVLFSQNANVGFIFLAGPYLPPCFASRKLMGLTVMDRHH